MSRRLWVGLGLFCCIVVGFSGPAAANEERGAWQNFATCLLFDGDACEAWRMSETVPLRKLYYYWQYRRDVDNKEYAGALENINAFIDAEIQDPTGYYNRGMLMGLQRKYSAAKDDFSIAIGLAPDRPDFYVTRGITNKGLGLWQEALDDFDQAISLGTRDVDAYHDRAVALDVLGRPAEALKAIQLSVEMQPDEPDVQNSLAIIYGNLGEYEEALTVFKNLHERWPENAAAYNGHCWMLAKQLERYEEALPYCERSLQIEPDESATLHSRGYIFLEMGRKAEAIADFRRAAELGNETDFVRDDLARALALPDE